MYVLYRQTLRNYTDRISVGSNAILFSFYLRRGSSAGSGFSAASWPFRRWPSIRAERAAAVNRIRVLLY